MVNEAIRTRQYREVLDAEKNISRQIYNLYQRQEAAYNEGIPSIRNQNQLAPIAGVIETVSAFQTELQNLMNGATNNDFQFTINNFVPVVKTFNSLVSALRSIQNIYKRDVQIKYEVDKLLKPVIDLIQSLASQLAYDPAISNRLFQMKTNLQSKVYERIDYNVGKRTIINEAVQTFQPGSQETIDTFQHPVQYDPESNDPFVGQVRIKPEAPATFEGLNVDGFNLEYADRAALKDWMDTTKALETNLADMAEPQFDILISQIATKYESLDRKIQTVLEANDFGLQKIKNIYDLYQAKLKNRSNKRKTQQQKGNKIPVANRSNPAQVQYLPPENVEEGAAVRSSRVFQQPITPQPALSLQASFSPQFGSVHSTPGSASPPFVSAQSSPGSVPRLLPSSPQKILVEMSDAEIKEMLQSRMGSGVFNQLKSDTFVGKGNSWPKVIENIKAKFRQDPQALVKHLNTNYQLSLPSPASSGKRKGQRQQTPSTPFSPVANMPFIEDTD